MRTISEDFFFDTYKPIKNPYNDGYGFDGCMFETFGPDLEYVKKVAEVNAAFVWTVLDVDGGMTIVSGAHFVNRLGYLVTELPADQDFIDVIVEDLTDHDDDEDDEYEDQDENILGA